MMRKARFSGQFYPSNPEEIKVLLNRITEIEQKKINTSLAKHKILGGIVPHAAYIYSAYQAVHFYEILKQSAEKFDTFVIINPNHTGLGQGSCNTSDDDGWETPFGLIAIDQEFTKMLDLPASKDAHYMEHSGEVQLPMLMHALPYSFKIVMLTMNHQTPDTASVLAEKISSTAERLKKKICLIASSDFNHFDSPEEGFRKDQKVIDPLLNFDSQSMYRMVKKHRVSTCGYGPMMTLCEYAKRSSEKPYIDLLKRGHSGEISPAENVVNYASFLCYE